MIRNITSYIFKITVISFILFSAYYLFVIKPDTVTSQKNIEATRVLYLHKNSLVQNRIAYLTLTRLDKNSANFDLEKSGVVSALKTTREEGLKLLENENFLPSVNEELSDRFPTLLSDTKSVYEEQKTIFEKVYSTGSYEDGLAIIESDEAVKLLTRQTNLILEYEWWIRKIGRM